MKIRCVRSLKVFDIIAWIIENNFQLHLGLKENNWEINWICSVWFCPQIWNRQELKFDVLFNKFWVLNQFSTFLCEIDWFLSLLYRSSNNVSSNLRSISPAIPGSNYPPSYSAAATSTNSATIVYEEYVNQNANDEPTERRSLSKNVSSENVENSTHSSVENDLRWIFWTWIRKILIIVQMENPKELHEKSFVFVYN